MKGFGGLALRCSDPKGSGWFAFGRNNLLTN